jgi:hypothetical protein
MLKRLFAWIGSLMARRRHAIAARATIPPSAPSVVAGQLDFSAADQSGLLVLLEDI